MRYLLQNGAHVLLRGLADKVKTRVLQFNMTQMPFTLAENVLLYNKGILELIYW